MHKRKAILLSKTTLSSHMPLSRQKPFRDQYQYHYCQRENIAYGQITGSAVLTTIYMAERRKCSATRFILTGCEELHAVVLDGLHTNSG